MRTVPTHVKRAKYLSIIDSFTELMECMTENADTTFASARKRAQSWIKASKKYASPIPAHKEEHAKYVIFIYLHVLLSQDYDIKPSQRSKIEKELRDMANISANQIQWSIWCYINFLSFMNYQTEFLDISRLPAGYGDQIDHSILAFAPIRMHLELSSHFTANNIHSDALIKVMLAAGDSLHVALHTQGIILQDSLQGLAKITRRYWNLFPANYTMGIFARKAAFNDFLDEKHTFQICLESLMRADKSSKDTRNKLDALEIFFEHHFVSKFYPARNKMMKELNLIYVIGTLQEFSNLKKLRTSLESMNIHYRYGAVSKDKISALQEDLDTQFIDAFSKEIEAIDNNDIMFGGKYGHGQRKWSEFQIHDILNLNSISPKSLMFCFAQGIKFMEGNTACVALDTIMSLGFKIEPSSDALMQLSCIAAESENILLINKMHEWGVDLSHLNDTKVAALFATDKANNHTIEAAKKVISNIISFAMTQQKEAEETQSI